MVARATDYEMASRVNEARDILSRQPRDFTIGRISGGGSVVGDPSCSLPYYTIAPTLVKWQVIPLTAKVACDSVLATDRKPTADDAYSSGDVSAMLANGSLVTMIRIESMWWIVDVLESTATPVNTSHDPFNCAYPGADIGVDCPLCSCGVDPWIIDPGSIKCGDAQAGGARSLKLTGGDVSSCTWQSDSFTSAGRSFIWSATLTADLKAILSLIETTSGTTTLAQWKCEQFCCLCQNCFKAMCPYYFPIPCVGMPEWICLNPSRCGLVVVGGCCTSSPAMLKVVIGGAGAPFAFLAGVTFHLKYMHGGFDSLGNVIWGGDGRVFGDSNGNVWSPGTGPAVVYWSSINYVDNAGLRYRFGLSCRADGFIPWILVVGVSDTFISVTAHGIATVAIPSTGATWETTCSPLRATFNIGHAGGEQWTDVDFVISDDNAGNLFAIDNNGVPVFGENGLISCTESDDCSACRCCYEFSYIPPPGTSGWLYVSTTCPGDDPDGGARCNAAINLQDVNDYGAGDNGKIFCFQA